MISGNEGKLDLITGAARRLPNPEPDTLSILDFSTYPPAVEHLNDVPNTVIGPPSNIAITPDRTLALIANSIRLDPANPTNWLPHTEIHLLDLASRPRKIIGAVHAGRQPSGMSISRDGTFALVANRADGTVTLLKIAGRSVTSNQTVMVCTPVESVSDVAISPDGRTALASVQKGGYLALLKIERGQVQFTGRKVSVYGQPYRCLITPDGKTAITAGQGFGNGLDRDAVTIIDLSGEEPRTIDYLLTGASPESVEISPNGNILAVVLMNGSNLPADHRDYSKSGGLDIFVRKGQTFQKVQSLKTCAIPEGVAFTSDGKKLVVQGHPSRELWIYSVGTSKVEAGTRIAVPGRPSSLRASP